LEMGRKHPEPYSKPYDPSVSTDVLLRQEPEEEEEEDEEEDEDEDDKGDNDDDEDDGYSACPCLLSEVSRYREPNGRFQAAAVSAL
jgi:hypothetical protein